MMRKATSQPAFFFHAGNAHRLMIELGDGVFEPGRKAIAYSMGHHSGGHLNPAVTLSPPASSCGRLWRCFCCLLMSVRTVQARITYTWPGSASL